ncbi:MAG: hypothetical protein JRG94_09425 [Deltaproteobacteria bacterium]|nr:hypothetical protein [Deltaproteobacteria bacterium]
MKAEPRQLSEVARPGVSRIVVGTLLFLFLVGLYHANSSLTRIGDIRPNVAAAISFVNEGNFSFTPVEFPGMFVWELDLRGEVYDLIDLSAWNLPIAGVPAAKRLADGEIRFSRHPYFLVASRQDQEYVSRYGLGSPITAVPVFVVLRAAVGKLRNGDLLSLYAGKFAAACCVAGSAVFIYLIASMYLSLVPALLVALTYAMGTSVWSTSSQGLWQHGPNELYLAMGCYFFIRIREGVHCAALAGLAVAMAIMCRPTSAALGLAIAMTLLVSRDFKLLMYFIAAGSVVGLIPMSYNAIHGDSILGFAQAMEADRYALAKTGTSSAWQFNILTNGAGMLFSPSRGLFVFSPVMAFAVAGIVPAWRDPRFAMLRPMSLALALTLLIQFCWFDWWGGWSYGYRLLVDTMVYLILFLIPLLPAVWKRRPVAFLFCLTLAWSVFVQGLGAFASPGRCSFKDWARLHHRGRVGTTGRSSR